MNVDIVASHTPYYFNWPEGPEDYEQADELLVRPSSAAPPVTLFVAYGWRHAYGEERRRILVFRSQTNVLAEFVGVDDWQSTREVATYLREPGARTYLRPEDGTPPLYQDLQLRNGRELFTGPYVRDAIVAVADEDDTAALVRVALARQSAQQAAYSPPRPHYPVVPSTPLPPATTSPAQSPQPAKVVQALLSYRDQQQGGGTFTHNPAADAFLRDNPFAVLLAASIDRGALAERVWEIPYLLRQKLGHLNPALLAQLTENDLEASIRSLSRRPRYPRMAAHTTISLANLVASRYSGDAARLWHNAPVQRVLADLQSVWGIGRGIAHMTVLILMDEFGYQPPQEELRTIDVKPDVHIVRVFYRTGLSSAETEAAAVTAARIRHPSFPGALDWPAWVIGRTFCFPKDPDCQQCPLDALCSKTGV